MSVIVTGHGRSGTHWLASTLGHFVDAVHEPGRHDVEADVVVDCRVWSRRKDILADGHELIHLIRDGRDVVRSTHTFWNGSYDFEHLCKEWARVVDALDGIPTLRLEALTARVAASDRHLLPHWTRWDRETSETFWRICGGQMRRHGYA